MTSSKMIETAVTKLFGHDWVEYFYGVEICRTCNLKRRTCEGKHKWMYYASPAYHIMTPIMPLCGEKIEV